MAGRLRGGAGGIRQVVELCEDRETRRLLEAGLLEKGLRLRWLMDGTDRLTWGDVVALLATAPEGSPLAVAHQGAVASWSTQEHLQAGVADALHLISYQLLLHMTGGKTEARPPKPIPRPGEVIESVEGDLDVVDTSEGDVPTDESNLPGLDESGRILGEATPVDELNEWLGWSLE